MSTGPLGVRLYLPSAPASHITIKTQCYYVCKLSTCVCVYLPEVNQLCRGQHWSLLHAWNRSPYAASFSCENIAIVRPIIINTVQELPNYCDA